MNSSLHLPLDAPRPPSLLLVEDEAKLAAYVRDGLCEEGYLVEVVSDGIRGLQLALERRFDAILLDQMLPGIDGLRLLAALRRSNHTPVLMLTACTTVDDRVRGLSAGADDYLTKPFAFSELVARIEGLIRRSQPLKGHDDSMTLLFMDLHIDVMRRRAKRGARQLELTSKEFTLLALLVRRQGEVLSRTEIAEQVWDMNFDSNTNVVDVAIGRLRAKLEGPLDQKLLHTVRGMGYVLEDRGW